MKQRCPCHSGKLYETCCQPMHLGQPSPTAERHMRSRYSAYTLKMADYLQKSWHTSSRPHDLKQTDLQGIKWLGLEILETNSVDSLHASVTFKAKFRTIGEKTQVLHEKSYFILDNGHWYYVNGDMLSN